MADGEREQSVALRAAGLTRHEGAAARSDVQFALRFAIRLWYQFGWWSRP
jgi:hypothetical protein